MIVSLIVEIPASADINEIEERVQEAGRQVMRRATQQAVREQEEQQMRCTYCLSEDVKRKGTKRRVVLTTYGREELGVLRRRCQQCGQGFRSAGACLKSLAGKNVTRAGPRSLQRSCAVAGRPGWWMDQKSGTAAWERRQGSRREQRKRTHRPGAGGIA